MTKRPILLWLRQDLRLVDNRALAAAIETGGPVIAVFVLDDGAAGEWAIGAGSRWWLHGSLSALCKEFEKRGARLLLRRGATADVLGELATETARRGRLLHPCAMSLGPLVLKSTVRASLATRGVELKRFGGNLLAEPDDISTKAGEPFKVYTPFWRELSGKLKLTPPIAAPARIPFPGRVPAGDELASWNLLPAKPDWAGGMRESWEPGEQGALKRFNAFIAGFRGYAQKRNRPDVPATSRLSPHLHWGEISPATLWRRASTAVADGAASDNDLEVFLKEIVWREFAYHLLVHWPDLPKKPFRPEFAAFPWAPDKAGLSAWQRGRTGYPDRRCRHARALAYGLDAQPRAHDRRLVPDQGPADPLARRRGAGSGTRSSMPIWPTIRQAGSGSPAPVPTRPPISASSTPCCRARSSIPMATMCAAGCPRSQSCPKSSFTRHGKPMLRPSTQRASSSAKPIRARSSTMPPPACLPLRPSSESRAHDRTRDRGTVTASVTLCSARSRWIQIQSGPAFSDTTPKICDAIKQIASNRGVERKCRFPSNVALELSGCGH